VFTSDLRYDEIDLDGYRSGWAAVGEDAGGQVLTVKVYEIPLGENLCPYHYEYEAEWLVVVVEGAVAQRTPEGEEELHYQATREIVDRGAVVPTGHRPNEERDGTYAS
jgi:hypothetical protein